MKRITPWEACMGVIFILLGLSGVTSGEMYRWGVPILYPRYFGAALMVLGVTIPVMAWFLRSPSRKRKDEGPGDGA